MTDTPTMTVEDLQAAVDTALWNYYPIREALSDLHIEVFSDGRIEISGPVRSGLLKDGVLDTLRWVPGVTGIVDGIVADSELEIELADVLASDPRLEALAPGVITVHCHLGEATLVGQVEDSALQEIAIMLASKVSGVSTVHNEMTKG